MLADLLRTDVVSPEAQQTVYIGGTEGEFFFVTKPLRTGAACTQAHSRCTDAQKIQ
jgi:hypothetical protein